MRNHQFLQASLMEKEKKQGLTRQQVLEVEKTIAMQEHGEQKL